MQRHPALSVPSTSPGELRSEEAIGREEGGWARALG